MNEPQIDGGGCFTRTPFIMDNVTFKVICVCVLMPIHGQGWMYCSPSPHPHHQSQLGQEHSQWCFQQVSCFYSWFSLWISIKDLTLVEWGAMVFNVTLVTFWMTLLMNRWTNSVVDEFIRWSKPCPLLSTTCDEISWQLIEIWMKNCLVSESNCNNVDL